MFENMIKTAAQEGSQCLLLVPQETPGAISRAALTGNDETALEAVDMFLSIIGAEAGHMGLRLLAKGGVYICGGITPKVRRRDQLELHPRQLQLRPAAALPLSPGSSLSEVCRRYRCRSWRRRSSN